jgi:signal transduction histidine kinase/CheY-like chemotaxis protein
MSRLRKSLRYKLLGVMLLTTGVALLVALAVMSGYDLRSYHKSWVADVRAQAELLGRTTAPALAFDDAKTARENLALLRFQPRIRAAAIYDARGRLFASYLAPGAQQPGATAPRADTVRVDGDRLLVFRRILDQGQPAGMVYLSAEYELYQRLATYVVISLVVAVLAMLVALLMSSWLQSVVTRPILAISATARHVIQRRDYSHRAQRVSEDEVGDLADAFNAMLEQIEHRTRELEASNQRVTQFNEALEQRVRERTAQLEASNRQLAQATDTAEKASRAKSEFLSNVSHELRTPLNAIIGFGQLLTTERWPASEEQRRTFMGHIVKAGQHLLTLINEILNLAQIESGKMSVSIESVRVMDILDDCRIMVESLAAGRGVHVSFPSSCPFNAWADRTRLKQVLLNLLSNAIKYNRDNGAVVVDCAEQRAGRIRISVRDTGMGLRPEQIELLFQAFNRLGRELGAEEGTGIGLVVTKGLVEMMGGEIGVESQPGVGSVFWIELNTAAAPGHAAAPAHHRPALPAAQQEAPAQPVATVLCVEDNPLSLELVRQVLDRRHGVRLLTATDGRMGVEMARAQQPDVILMDNNMPHLSGADAQAVLRDDPATAGIPVIALTANAMPHAVQAGLAAGFYRYLTKPLDVEQLNRALDDALAVARERQAARGARRG